MGAGSRRVRAISNWATAAMLAIAGVALAYLVVAFVPLIDVWAAHRATRQATTIATAVRFGAWGVLALASLVAVATFGTWLARARANLAAFSGGRRRARTRQLAVAAWLIPVVAEVAVGSIGRAPVLRRKMITLTWLWWGSLVAAGLAVVIGLLAGLDNVREIEDVRRQAAGGDVIDGALAARLFGRQLMLRLPAAALFVVAAVLALLLIARTTSAQYGRVARLRGAPSVATLAALRSTSEEWTVVIPAALLLADPDATAVLPAAPPSAVGGTIRG